MLLQNYRPRSKLKVKTSFIEWPRFPVIDAHNHIGSVFGGEWFNRPVDQFLEALDEANVRVFVDLDGGWGEDILQKHLDKFKASAPDRFIHFGGVDWSRWVDLGDRFPDWAVDRLHQQVKWGAQGLKIWKKFGLDVRDSRGSLVSVNDTRLEPLWESAAEMGIPVLIHVADPLAFFDPLDEHNERWEELRDHPDWHFPSPPNQPFLNIMKELSALVARHTSTIFIGAHVGCYAENLSWVGDLLGRAPNFYIDISARISELGRQPYSARRLFLDYADRILFGTDMGPDPETYRIYYRFLESEDEYFNYSASEIPDQGRWQIYGLSLPDEVLEKVYYQNTVKVLGIKGSLP